MAGWASAVRFRSGGVARVRYGGLVAAPVFGLPPVAGDGWTAGPLEDLLWARLPDVRAGLVESVAEELARATEMDRVLWTLSDYDTVSLFWHDAFLPALEGLPATAAVAATCCDVLREVAALDAVLGGCYQDPLKDRLLSWLVLEPHRSRLASVDPGLAGLVEQWEAQRWPASGPAVVVDDRVPPAVDDAELGRGWLEVDAGSGRVATLRYGGIVSWALLALAPEPAEVPMDLGLGPLADLVWAGLPAARPALAGLALAELDAAVRADRLPAAVPGPAVVAAIGPAVRAALAGPPGEAARTGAPDAAMPSGPPAAGTADAAVPSGPPAAGAADGALPSGPPAAGAADGALPSGPPGDGAPEAAVPSGPPGDAVRRCCRLLGRLVDTDAGLSGRHHGAVAESLGRLTRPPYRSALSAADPALLARLDRSTPA